MSDKLTGVCLCGAVTYEASGTPFVVGHCYCDDCRKASGTTHGTHVGLPADAVTLTGELRSYDKHADSGNVVTRSFCPDCGCAIHSTNSGMPGMMFIRASSLDDLNAVSPQMTVYAARAPKWALLDTSGPVFDEMPPNGPPVQSWL